MGIRIIAGEFGGRRLEAPPGRETRPTSDRVREALFSILGSVEELVVLDVYAGSGALGLEALSRGAKRATFIDQSRLAIATLRKNIATLGVGDRCEEFTDLVFSDGHGKRTCREARDYVRLHSCAA